MIGLLFVFIPEGCKREAIRERHDTFDEVTDTDAEGLKTTWKNCQKRLSGCR
jgi:hypothetical protein